MGQSDQSLGLEVGGRSCSKAVEIWLENLNKKLLKILQG